MGKAFSHSKTPHPPWLALTVPGASPALHLLAGFLAAHGRPTREALRLVFDYTQLSYYPEGLTADQIQGLDHYWLYTRAWWPGAQLAAARHSPEALAAATARATAARAAADWHSHTLDSHHWI